MQNTSKWPPKALSFLVACKPSFATVPGKEKHRKSCKYTYICMYIERPRSLGMQKNACLWWVLWMKRHKCYTLGRPPEYICTYIMLCKYTNISKCHIQCIHHTYKYKYIYIYLYIFTYIQYQYSISLPPKKMLPTLHPDFRLLDTSEAFKYKLRGDRNRVQSSIASTTGNLPEIFRV